MILLLKNRGRILIKLIPTGKKSVKVTSTTIARLRHYLTNVERNI